MDAEHSPPLGYLDSLELALVLKGEIDDADVRAIFAHGKQLEFWGCPQLLVSKIVEAFIELHQAPAYLDVTITALFGLGATRPSEAWPQAYRTYLPCYACTTVETVEERNIPRLSEWRPRNGTDFAVEKFHVSSKSFGKQLTVELYYQLEQGTTVTEREKLSFIHKIVVRLTDETCSAKARLLPAIATRSSASSLLLPEFALEVFGFLDRAHIGSSLLANRDLCDLLHQLKQRLPVHNLKCAFQKELFGRRRWFNGIYWLTIRHFRRDLSYTDVRRFKIPSTAGAEDDSALIRRYLSNSHVADLQAAQADFAFAIKMLASLAAHNFSVGRVDLRAGAKHLSDYRSMDAVFGEMQMSELDLSCAEHRFVELVKTIDFFRMPMVQKLRQLKLNLSPPLTKADELRRHSRSKSPLWTLGMSLLPNCEYYRVEYWPNRHVPSIERKIVQICEKFERGEITDTVEHFYFKSDTSKGMNHAFSRDNLLVSGMKVEGNPFPDIAWDVYRFRNGSTGGYLTACVGRNASDPVETILHIVRGEVYPDASFADYADDDI